MFDHRTEDGDGSTKVSSSSEPAVRKLTPSCARCRASKLKCDRKVPCIECVKRNIGHLCTKDERRPRAKRTKTARNKDDNNDISANASTSHGKETEAEEAAQVLEQFVDGTARTNAYPTLPCVAPDYPDTYWSTTNDPQRQGEKLALIREIVDAMPELDIIHVLNEVFVTRCQAPLGNVVHTPTFLAQAEVFRACLGLASPEARVMALSSIISMPTLACHLLALVLALAFHPTPSLLVWSSTPLALRVQELRASGVHSKTWRSLALRCLQGGLSLFCGSIASLQAAIMLLLDGQDESLALDVILVTAISGARAIGLHRLGDARLRPLASPISSYEDISSTSTDPLHIRTEIGIRIWWALVVRDWSRGPALRYYNIHPSQFNTRKPLHIHDNDLCSESLKIDSHGHVTERPRSEFTMLSYTVFALEIAIFARESIDMAGPIRQAQRQEHTSEDAKMRNYLNKKYENFVAKLPSHFRLGSTIGLISTTGPTLAIPVHRWMLHQQLWSLFLRLHRASLLSHDGRASCQLLAQNIISTQGQIQARCAVCGSLSTNETQLFNAAVVLLVDLLFSSKHEGANHSSAQLSRLMARDRSREAIELLQAHIDAERSSSQQDPQPERIKFSAQRSIMALEALMKLEEEESGNNEESTRANLSSSSGAKQVLKSKIMDVLEALRRNAKNTAAIPDQAFSSSVSALDMSMPVRALTGGTQNLEVLPVVSNDPNYSLWQFLDFDPPPPQSSAENVSFPATANLESLGGSMYPMLSSGAAPSWDSSGTPEFADMYSHIDGTHIGRMPPPFTESGHATLSGGSEAAGTPSTAGEFGATSLY